MLIYSQLPQLCGHNPSHNQLLIARCLRCFAPQQELVVRSKQRKLIMGSLPVCGVATVFWSESWYLFPKTQRILWPMAHFSMTIMVQPRSLQPPQGINAVYMDSLTHAVLLSVQILSVLKENVGSLALIPSGKFIYSLPHSTPPHPVPPCRIVYAHSSQRTLPMRLARSIDNMTWTSTYMLMTCN